MNRRLQINYLSYWTMIILFFVYLLYGNNCFHFSISAEHFKYWMDFSYLFYLPFLFKLKITVGICNQSKFDKMNQSNYRSIAKTKAFMTWVSVHLTSGFQTLPSGSFSVSGSFFRGHIFGECGYYFTETILHLTF